MKKNQKQENVEKEFKEKLKTIYEKLIDPEIEEKEKFELSHLIIDRIEFDKSAETLYLSYKYQMWLGPPNCSWYFIKKYIYLSHNSTFFLF